MISNYDLVENIKLCSVYNTCNKNLCPLDYELDLRVGKTSDKCKYMRRDRATMPDELLENIPTDNVKRLNIASQKRYSQICP